MIHLYGYPAMITSLHNERIKRVRALKSRSQARREARQFVIEGPNIVQEALRASSPLLEAFYTEAFASTDEGSSLLGQLGHRSVNLEAVSDPVMKSISETVTPQGILAIALMPDNPRPEHPTFVLISDAVGDPGNMGSILRVAAGAGVEAVAIMPGTVDIYAPKVVRGAVGAHFRLGLHILDWGALASWLAGQTIFLADSSGGQVYFTADLVQPCALIVSSEAHGPGPEAQRAATGRVTIPMPGGMESLNVAIASGILIYEMLRQRATRQETCE